MGSVWSGEAWTIEDRYGAAGLITHMFGGLDRLGMTRNDSEGQ